MFKVKVVLHLLQVFPNLFSVNCGIDSGPPGVEVVNNLALKMHELNSANGALHLLVVLILELLEVSVAFFVHGVRVVAGELHDLF